MLKNRFYRVRHVLKWSVQSCKGVDFLMLRNRVFRLRKYQKWAVLCSNEVDFLMIRNPVFRLRNIQKWAVHSASGLFADAQELCFKAANLINRLLGCDTFRCEK